MDKMGIYEILDKPERKRIRVVPYYEDLEENYKFLTLYRNSELHPGLEFPKEGFDGRTDGTLLCTFRRGLLQETGIRVEDLISYESYDFEDDYITYRGKDQYIRTFIGKVGYPAPRIRFSDEHKEKGSGWFDYIETYKNFLERGPEREADAKIFPIVLNIISPKLVIDLKQIGCLRD